MALTPTTYTPGVDTHAPAIPGMLADNMFTDKGTVPCGSSAVQFGTVVATSPTTGISVLPIPTAGTPPAASGLQGIAIHDHAYAGSFTQQNGYIQFDAISVLARGRIWALASGTCTRDGPARFDPANGTFSDTGTITYPNAKFITGAINLGSLLSSIPNALIVQVELHAPAL